MKPADPSKDRLDNPERKRSAAVLRVRHLVGGMAPSLFLREWMHHPAAIGAVWPSSTRLAHRMAACVPRSGDGLVVELGAGTGAVTQALLDSGIAAHRLVVVERSARFVGYLRRRFPGVTVLHGDALRLAALLPAGSKVDAIVSSLPLRSLAQTDARTIVAQWQQVLRLGGRAIQFTYDLRGSLRHRPAGLRHRGSHLVWANLPPARIFVLEAQA